MWYSARSSGCYFLFCYRNCGSKSWVEYSVFTNYRESTVLIRVTFRIWQFCMDTMLVFLMNPRNRVIVNVIVAHIVEIFPAIFAYRIFILIFTTGHQRPPSWAKKNKVPLPTPKSHFLNISFSRLPSSHLRFGLPNGIFLSGSSIILSTHLPSICFLPHSLPYRVCWFDPPNDTWWTVPSIWINYIPCIELCLWM
jgi:hypothetical protein